MASLKKKKIANTSFTLLFFFGIIRIEENVIRIEENVIRIEENVYRIFYFGGGGFKRSSRLQCWCDLQISVPISCTKIPRIGDTVKKFFFKHKY